MSEHNLDGLLKAALAAVACLLFGSFLGMAWADLRDPTMPYGFNAQPTESTDADTGGVVLSGIISGPRGMSAVINGKRVRVGDRIQGRQVVSIKRDSVVLSDGSRQQTLYLLSQTFKKQTPTGNGGMHEQ